MDPIPHIVSIAPMMKRTDRHYRYMMRLITQRTLLYSEMVTTGAVLFGDREKLLGFSEREKPVSLQLGGVDQADLAECARIVADFGYDEVNLNVGCPSDRVQNGDFGACLMRDPAVVARAVEGMRKAVDIPVTVKHRIGVDELDRYEDMLAFVRVVADAGCERFTVHARKAWLNGLSPKDNRTVPPLRYRDVYRLKRELPQLFIEINGGICTWQDIQRHLQWVDAVMIGRAAYDNPYLFAGVDSEFFGIEVSQLMSRHQVVEAMFPYIDWWLGRGGKLHHITRHMLQLFAGQPRGKLWRRLLSQGSYAEGADSRMVADALAMLPKSCEGRG